MSGLNEIVTALDDHARATPTQRGERIVWTCAHCGQSRWSYERYLLHGATVEDAIAFMALKHQCGGYLTSQTNG